MLRIVKSKNAALELSINAIIILILAITMLGLGLTFTRGLFKSASSKMFQAVEGTSLKNPADAEHPVTIDEQLQLKRNAQERLEVGFYNRANLAVNDVSLVISECIDTSGASVAEENLPRMIAPTINEVESATDVGFKTILTLESDSGSGLTPNSYICTLKACTPASTGTTSSECVTDKEYEEVQFFLEVTP